MDITLNEINNRLERIERLTLIGAKNVLDFDEAAAYLGFSEGHLYRLTSTQQVPHYKKNRKLYFDKTELDNWMRDTRVVTSSEIDRKADTYNAINPF